MTVHNPQPGEEPMTLEKNESVALKLHTAMGKVRSLHIQADCMNPEQEQAWNELMEAALQYEIWKVRRGDRHLSESSLANYGLTDKELLRKAREDIYFLAVTKLADSPSPSAEKNIAEVSQSMVGSYRSLAQDPDGK